MKNFPLARTAAALSLIANLSASAAESTLKFEGINPGYNTETPTFDGLSLSPNTQIDGFLAYETSALPTSTTADSSSFMNMAGNLSLTISDASGSRQYDWSNFNIQIFNDRPFADTANQPADAIHITPASLSGTPYAGGDMGIYLFMPTTAFTDTTLDNVANLSLTLPAYSANRYLQYKTIMGGYGTGGNLYSEVNTVNAVPEPSVVALAGIAMAGAIGSRRFRRF